MTESKSAPTAGVKRSEQKEEMLTPEESSRFRSLTMRGCYLALDRPDIAFACKELARAMAKTLSVGLEWLETVGEILAWCS